jgi:hypothetical protein
MNQRKRLRETLLFGAPDRVPLEPGSPRESTLRVWRGQGLPEDAHWHAFLLETLGIPAEAGGPGTQPGVSFQMIPTFQEEVLEHRDGHYVVRDWMGAITEISDEYDYTYIRSAKDFVTRRWHRFPVENRADWEQMQQRYDPSSPERFPDDWQERCAIINAPDRDWPVSIFVNGPFWQLREWCGLENLCRFMIEQPEWVLEMAACWGDFVSCLLAAVLPQIEIDIVHISEDMAYKAHSMISPAMVRRFLQPVWWEWTDQVFSAGCPLVDMDSDGCIEELIPLWIESGINVCDPIEVAAHNDIVAFREQYGMQIAFRGGIDKRALARGGETMRREVERVAPPLLLTGGYIPGCDHGIPSDVSWPNFVEYVRLLAQLTGWL